MRGLARLFRITGIAIAALIVIACVLFGALQTGWGKSMLASLGSHLASSDDIQVEITAIEGFVPSDMRVERVVLSDRKGIFAEIAGLHLDWSPLSLLSGEIAVASIGAETLSVVRKPDLPPSEETESGRLPGLGVSLEKLALPQIRLGEELLGQAATLSISGSAMLRQLEQGFSAKLEVRRLDAKGTIDAELAYAPETELLDININASEPEGGLVARALGIETLPPLTLKVAGKDPLSAFTATIDLAAGDEGYLRGTVQVQAEGEQYRVHTALQADAQRLVSESIAPLVEGISDIQANLLIARTLRIDVQEIALRSTGAGAYVTGEIDPTNDRINLRAHVVAGDSSRYAALLPATVWGSLDITSDITGTLSAPNLKTDLTASGLGASGYAFGETKISTAINISADGDIGFDLSGTAGEPGEGAARVDGSLIRQADGGISARNLVVSVFGIEAVLDGRIDPQAANLTARISASDLSRLDDRIKGRAMGEARFSGTLENLSLTSRITIPDGEAMGERIDNLALDITAQDITGSLNATSQLAGFVGGRAVQGRGGIATQNGIRTLDGLQILIGSAHIAGSAILPPEGPITGQFDIDAADLSELSAFALKDLAGRLKAIVSLENQAGIQGVAIEADATGLRMDDANLQSARIALRLLDPTRLAGIDGTAEIRGVSAGAVQIETADLRAFGTSGGTSIKLDARAQGAAVTTSALLSQEGNARALRLDTLKVVKNGSNVSLARPALFTFQDGLAGVDRLELAAGGGKILVQGSAGESFDLTVDLKQLPLSLASLVDPTLALSGTLSGRAEIGGTAEVPVGTYNIDISNLSMPDLARSGVGPFGIKTQGALADGRTGVNIAVSGRSLSGVTVIGSIPIGQGPLDLAAKGQVGLNIANASLATSGARVSGTAIIDARIEGTVQVPQVSGNARISGGTFEDTINGVALDQITALASGTGTSVTLSSFSANTRNGGSIGAQGEIAVDAARGFPGRVDIVLRNAGLVQSELMRFVADGQMVLEGPLASRPRVQGRVDVKALDINIPDKLPGGGSSLDVRHVNVVPGSGATVPVRRRQTEGDGATFLADLDLLVSAPNGVFVRGMGMEAELGGELKVSGTMAQPTPFGAFEMRRGRFDVLGKRLDFTRGNISFSGTNDPALDFVAETSANDVTASILVAGTASAPEVTFSSTPVLPQDEVISRLMFGRSAAQLSASQALQVAQTILQFSGGGPGMMDNVRKTLGVDSLDIGTGEGGKGGQVGIGKRLNDRIYFGFKQGTEPGSTKATIDLDITRNIRVQGATDANGGGEVGIGAQWDY